MEALRGARKATDENGGVDVLSPTRMMRKRKVEVRDDNHQAQQPDFEWENSKENVMPLKRGRNVTDLNRALRTHESYQAKTNVETKAKEMEAEVKAYKGDDPLSAWVQYIRWIETNMPEDTRKKFGALEKSTRELKDITKYKNDIRYIRLWIQYADLVSNPKDIFKYLYQNKIGDHVSLFFVGWAWVLESMGNYAQANKVYLKATQKKAEPEELLSRKYKEFQRRMSRHWLKVNQTTDSNDDSMQRSALEDLSCDQADFERMGNSENFRRYARAQAEKMQRANAHKPVFTIYEDPVGTEVDTLDENADWKSLDTMQHQNKENDTAPTRWNGPLERPQHVEGEVPVAVASRRPVEPLQVFVDEEFSASDQKPSVVGKEHSLTLRQRLDGVSTEEEQLAQKPLKNFAAQKTESSKPPRAIKTKTGPEEKLVFDPALLKTTSGETLCFEELRARKYANKREETGHRHTHAKGLQPPLPKTKPAAKVDPLFALDTAAQEDMTINTRVAMEDVNNMFCSPGRDERASPPRSKKTWGVPEAEPVERKLHFSIFEDSMDSIAPHQDEVSQKHKLKKPIKIRLSKSISIQAVGFLGSGAFAQVFAVKAHGLDPSPSEMALKFEKTEGNLAWEMYIIYEIQKRLTEGGRVMPLIQLPILRRLDTFKNGSMLLMKKGNTGTLHDLLNAYRKNGRQFPETLAVYYSIRMLRAVELLHAADVLHGDIKPDNWLLVPGSFEQALSIGTMSKNTPHEATDLQLIDFGRAIDLRHFPHGTRFSGDCHVKGFKTVEMLTKRPWTYQIDTFGICATAHCMLFGEYMEVSKRTDENGKSRWGIVKSLKRYWDIGMWASLFHTFLNVGSCEKQPSLPMMRRRFESYFLDNPNKLEELRGLLVSQQTLLSRAKF
ncbi:hypothetical protein Poli38472_002204 [Pythium oligandrum]|uniref:Uncharacterized protein n=1 Tax=Pythium oligandrum TaxID=41045 RepID=A0A8K1CIV1_PYTOL|nr:hypothetical protein Poli38472_002204 [Pythium oligandrum]|eukprot:TMW63263.1 hypothetical protein Poli38472_002204 [Pythium oligandrum]